MTGTSAQLVVGNAVYLSAFRTHWGCSFQPGRYNPAVSEDGKKKSALQELFDTLEGYPTRNPEAETLGVLLYEMQDTEHILTILLGVWHMPLIPARFDSLVDDFLLKVPIRDKISFLESKGLLSKDHAGQLQNLFTQRNLLAHPRPLRKSILNEFPAARKLSIFKLLSEVKEATLKHIDEQTKLMKTEYRAHATSANETSNPPS